MSKKEKRRGFTLLEILIVIAIIGALAVMMLPRFIKTEEKAYVTKAEAEVNTLRTALAMYKSDVGSYPPSITTLSSWDNYLVTNAGSVTGWNGPYCDRAVNDPWGNPYVFYNYFDDADNYSYVASFGPNGTWESDCTVATGPQTSGDDIVVWLE